MTPTASLVGVSTHKAGAMLGILERLGLIEKVGGYVPGLRGWVWAVRKPSSNKEVKTIVDW